MNTLNTSLFDHSGHEAVIVKNGLRLCGTGGARASTAIQQNKAYWEVKLQQSGVWACGVCTATADLNRSGVYWMVIGFVFL